MVQELGGDTILTGLVIDQAALHGILNRIRDLGVPLLSVKRVEQDETNILGFLFLPILFALAMSKLSVVIVSTVVWQFAFSGFGEESVYRGYYQPRMNQAFGRPVRLFGIQFGVGLIIASLLFELNHALNTYDPAMGCFPQTFPSAFDGVTGWIELP